MLRSMKTKRVKYFSFQVECAPIPALLIGCIVWEIICHYVSQCIMSSIGVLPSQDDDTSKKPVLENIPLGNWNILLSLSSWI